MIITQTPLRVSFLGGGTDFEDFYAVDGGAVLSSAINKYVFVVVKERFDDKIYVNYSKKEIVDRVDELQHELVREAMRRTRLEKGVEITTLADVPAEGTGLGSSSSTTVGLLQALYTYQGETKTAEALAREACEIEIDVLGKPIGKQDQYIAAYGNMRFITFGQDGVMVEKVALNREQQVRLNESFILFYTGITRRADDILAEQKESIAEKREQLNELKRLAFRGRELLLTGGFDEFGELLHWGWELKRQLASKVTNSVIDEIYQVARKAGAIGGKVTGAGGGGFLLLYCDGGRRDDVRQALHGLRELPFRFEHDGSKVIFNYREGS